MTHPICELRDITKEYHVHHSFFESGMHKIRALDRVNLSINKGEILGLVGESGCGKTTLAKIALGVETPSEGQVLFSGRDISHLDRTDLKEFRRKVQMVFQDPFSSLNPKKTVFKTLSEPLSVHRLCPRRHYRERVAGLLEEVGLDARVMDRYPHEFSGGQRQRIGLARALATGPEMIVADEPTSALDVSIQAQIINLFLDLQERYGLSYLFISHDLNIIQFVSQRVAVMYKGQLMELMPREAFLQIPGHQTNRSICPHHPYTQLLLSTVPVPDPDRPVAIKEAWRTKDGLEDRVPVRGCAFSSRCKIATERCRRERPLWNELTKGHFISCHFVRDLCYDSRACDAPISYGKRDR